MGDLAGSCFHCGEPIPAGIDLRVLVTGEQHAVCCAGCRAAAEFIRDAGLSDYYRFRSAPAPRPAAGEDDSWSTYDRPEVQERLVVNSGGAASVNLLLEGMRCAACSWLVERRLERMSGVTAIAVNPATARARLEFRPVDARLSDLLRAVHALGYRPHVLGASDTLEVALRERRQALKRLAVAGFGMMQVMTFAVALYAGAFEGMDPVMREYFRVISMLVTTPVFLYSGWPFLDGAWRNLRARHLGMDVPVAIGLVLAFGASVLNTLAGAGEVYFDSVVMFVFLLLLGRYVEMTARHHAGSTSDALVRLRPSSALRLRNGTTERVGVAELAVGDTVLVPQGEPYPADGVVVEGTGAADESLLTGESTPVAKPTGSAVIGGSTSVGAPVQVRVTALGHDTVLAGVLRLLERAQTERPRVARIADHWASWFVGRVLLGAAIVAALWLWLDPSRAFEATLAVLVVTCPCALSLATPTAVTAATARLARHGLLVTHADALETLASATRVVFDKTGTLTLGLPAITDVRTLSATGRRECLAIAAALEQASEHPLARAFRGVEGPLPVPTGVVVSPGRGLEARIDGRCYRIGTRDYVEELSGPTPGHATESQLSLGGESGWLAQFNVTDPLRPGAAAAVAALSTLGLRVEVASGDHAQAVESAVGAAGIVDWQARMRPEDKLRRIQELRSAGETVVMVGDGINDAPVLRGASVSIAMGAGTSLAQTSADMVLMSQSLGEIARAVTVARSTVRIVRQNLVWSAAYNLLALPLAAFGLVPPWAAAIGMSASSLLVVVNAMRLRAEPAAPGRHPSPGVAGASP